MKKYRLIKKYPGSPELEDVIEKKEGTNMYFYKGLQVMYPEKHPEFWKEVVEVPQYVKCVYIPLCPSYELNRIYKVINNKVVGDSGEILDETNWDNKSHNGSQFTPSTKEEYDAQFVKKDYEILSLKLTNQENIVSVKKGDIVKTSRCVKGHLQWQMEDGKIDSFSNDKITLKSFDIHSVKRLSDGEIFTVGDKVVLPTKQVETILKISIVSEKIILYYQTNSYISNTDVGTGNWFELIKKYKEPLFTTEDGVNIFKGDLYYIIDYDKWRALSSIANFWSGPKNLKQYFSTKKAAENFIKCNKPCLSYNDVWNMTTNKSSDNLWSIVTKKQLEELVKTKLK